MRFIKRCKKPLSLLLIASLILSLVPVVPINIAKADNYDSIRDGIYSGGFDIYKGVKRDDCARSYDVKPSNIKGQFLNVEATIDRKQAIYGDPEDVPGNFVSYQAGFKAVSNGYFYATQTNGVWHLKTSGTRGYFRYIGYDINGNVISDQQFPPDVAGGYIPVSASTQLVATPWNNATAKQICSVANNYNKPDSPIYDQAFNNIDSLKDERGNSLGQALSKMGKSKSDFINSAMILNPSGTKYVAQVVLVLIDNGIMHYRTYTGPINKAKPQLKSDSITIGIDIQSYLLNAGTDSYKYNPTTQKDPSFTVTITGTMTDYYTSKTNDGGYYKAFNYTREDVTKYTTIINYVKVNGTEIDVTKEYVDANISETQANKIIFKTANPSQLRVTIPKNMLQQGTNTITMAGKTRVYFDNGQWVDAGDSASNTITVINDYKPATPTLKLNVTPTPTEVNISNGIYNPTNIQHNIGATVSISNIPAGYKIGNMEFKVDKTTNLDSVSTITKTINNTNTNNTLNNITYFNFDTTKIPITTKKSTPSYYGKVRYSLVNTTNSSEVWWSDWSSLASTTAEVNLKIAQGNLTGTLSNSDKIVLDSSGNVKGTSSKNFTATFTVTGSLSDTGNKTIKDWTVKIYHTNGTESQTYTINTTSKNMTASNKQLTIATDKNRTTENFIADVIVNFTDNTNIKTQTNTVSIPVEIEGNSGITLNFSGSKSTLSGKVGDTVSVTLNADSKVTTTKNVTNYSIWIRKSDESLSSPTNSTTSNVKTLSASKPYSFKLAKNMNNTTVTFIARAKATLNDGTVLDSGQKTFTVTLIVSDNPPPVSDNPPSAVNCNGAISPTSASATKNPFTGVIDPPTTSVQVGVSASVDAGSKTVSKWELYCDSELLKTITGNNTSVSAPLGAKTYTVSNEGTRTFNFRAKVYFTDGTTLEGTDTKVFGATQQEIPNNPPSVTISAVPNVVPQGDDSYIIAYATDPDINNGDTVTISKSVNDGNFDGNTFWSDTIGTYVATAIATDSKGLSSSANTTISVIPAIPTPRLITSGTLKENRKVILDGSYSNAGSKRAIIDWANATWTITPTDSSIPQSDIKVVESLTGSQKLTALFKTSGKYKVTLTIINNYGNQQTGTWYIDIQPDKLPVVDFTMPTKVIRDPADSSKATIQITSNSFSPDNDTIAKHVWFYAWDSNNDGNFDNETWYIRKSDGTWQTVGDYNTVKNYDVENFDSGNNNVINLKVDKVGKYKIELICREEFGQETLSQFVTGYDRRRNNTFEQDEEKKVSEVINVAPYATLSSNKIDKKKVNLNILTDKTDTASINAIKSKLDSFKSELYSYGVDVNYSITDGNNRSVITKDDIVSFSGGVLKSGDLVVFDDIIAYDYTTNTGIGIIGSSVYYIKVNGSYPNYTLIKKIFLSNLIPSKIYMGSLPREYYILFPDGAFYQININTDTVNYIDNNVKNIWFIPYMFTSQGFGITSYRMYYGITYNIVSYEKWDGNTPYSQVHYRGKLAYLNSDEKIYHHAPSIINMINNYTELWTTYINPYTLQPNDSFNGLIVSRGYSSDKYAINIYPFMGMNDTIIENNYYVSYFPQTMYLNIYGNFFSYINTDIIYARSDFSGYYYYSSLYETFLMPILDIGPNQFIDQGNSGPTVYVSGPMGNAANNYHYPDHTLIIYPQTVINENPKVWHYPSAVYYYNGIIRNYQGTLLNNNVKLLFLPNYNSFYASRASRFYFKQNNSIYYYENGSCNYLGNNSYEAINYSPAITNYKENADNYVIYTSDSQGSNTSAGWGNYFAFGSIDENFFKFMIRNNNKFYGISPSSTFAQILDSKIQKVTLQQLANATDGKLYDSAGNAITQLDQALNDIKAKYTNNTTKNEVYVLADEQQVQYYPYSDDYENDFILNQRWKYKQDTSVFDNPNGTLPQNDTWVNSPIDTFSQVGKYLVTYQVQDSPPPMDDSNFDEYRQWSKLEDQLTIYVHRRPIADFTAIKNASNKLVITDRSYDLDHQYNRADKGIINRKWQYKTIDDSTWTDTTLSNLQNMTLLSNKIYLIKLEVQDCDGINGVGEWSKPNIQIVDTTIANNPPVAQFDIQNQIKQGTQPVMTDNSFDPDGDTITTWHWWIYNSDNTVNKDFGEVGNNNIANVKSYIATLGVGNYIAKLQVKDSAGNYSAIASKNFTVYTDTQQPEATNNAPTGTFTMTINDFRTKLKPTTTYTDPDSDPKNAEQWYIKFNGQTQYYDKLPNTLEEAGYIYDGQYEIGYRVQDNPTARSSKLTPLWSNWYTQVYNLSSTFTITAYTEKLTEKKLNQTDTIKTNNFKVGEGILIRASTTGYAYKVEAYFYKVQTTTKNGLETKYFNIPNGYWQCNKGSITKGIAGSMTPTSIVATLIADNTANNSYAMSWHTKRKGIEDSYEEKLLISYPIWHNNLTTNYNKNLWEGCYIWQDWVSKYGYTFDYNKMIQEYGRTSYISSANGGDKLTIRVIAYKKNADGTDTSKYVDLSVNIIGTIQYGTEILN